MWETTTSVAATARRTWSASSLPPPADVSNLSLNIAIPQAPSAAGDLPPPHDRRATS